MAGKINERSIETRSIAHRRDKLKEYQAAFKREKRKEGYKQCTVWVHETQLEEFKRFMESLQDEPVFSDEKRNSDDK